MRNLVAEIMIFRIINRLLLALDWLKGAVISCIICWGCWFLRKESITVFLLWLSSVVDWNNGFCDAYKHSCNSTSADANHSFDVSALSAQLVNVFYYGSYFFSSSTFKKKQF